MNRFDYADWRDRTRVLAQRYQVNFEERFGYEPDDHTIGIPTGGDVIEEALRDCGDVMPSALIDFYRVCSEVSLPDLHAGYFISPLRRVIDGIAADDPVRMGGRWGKLIATFGSDGGGTLFALELGPGGPVYSLPPGRVDNQVYEEAATTPATAIATDLPEFLMKLQGGLASAVHGDAFPGVT